MRSARSAHGEPKTAPKMAKAIQVMGSALLAAQLIEHDLVDEYRLMIEPILLGGGKRVFPGDGRARALELVSTTTTGTGVLICTYRPAVHPPRPTRSARRGRPVQAARLIAGVSQDLIELLDVSGSSRVGLDRSKCCRAIRD
jgi:hypothetical protein